MGSCGGGEPDIDNGLQDSVEGGKGKEGDEEGLEKWALFFFEEEGELGMIKKRRLYYNGIEYSRVENDINKRGPILIHDESAPPSNHKTPITLFSAFSLSLRRRVLGRQGGEDEERADGRLQQSAVFTDITGN